MRGQVQSLNQFQPSLLVPALGITATEALLDRADAIADITRNVVKRSEASAGIFAAVVADVTFAAAVLALFVDQFAAAAAFALLMINVKSATTIVVSVLFLSLLTHLPLPSSYNQRSCWRSLSNIL